MIKELFNLQKIKPENPFFINENSDFSNLEIRSTEKPEFWYFYDKVNSCYVTSFVLTDQPVVQRRCDVVLIKNDVGFFEPRFSFYIWDKKKNEKIKEIKDLDKLEKIGGIKALVNLDEGSKNFWKLLGYLTNVKSISLSDFKESFRIVDGKSYIVEFESKDKAEKIKDLNHLIDIAELNEIDLEKIINNSRKKSLEQFRKLLVEKKYWEEFYKENQENIKGVGEEAVWHYFLKINSWIIGLGVDIKFIRDLTDEVNVGVPNTDGCGCPKVDMLGISDYTTLVEFKTPHTDIFTKIKKTTARANTWSFTDSFIDGISQCLGQKFDWDKTQKNKDLVKDGEILDQDIKRTIDPKTFFIIGNKKREFPEEIKTVDNIIKRDTFQRFVRNNRNIEIITFDELYERAYFIVHEKQMPDDYLIKN